MEERAALPLSKLPTQNRPARVAGFSYAGEAGAETTRNPAVTPMWTDGPAISRKSGFLPRYPRRFPRNRPLYRPRNRPAVDDLARHEAMNSTRDNTSLPWPGWKEVANLHPLSAGRRTEAFSPAVVPTSPRRCEGTRAPYGLLKPVRSLPDRAQVTAMATPKL